MGRVIKFINNQLVTNFDYDPVIIESLRKMKFWWRPEDKTWRKIYSDDLLLPILQFIERFNFKRDDSFNSLIGNIVNQEEDFKSIENKEYEVTEQFINENIPLFKLKPRNYQWFAIKYNLSKKKVINGDDIGLGKTLETIFTIQSGNLYPCLVICPLSIVYNWEFWFNSTVTKKVKVIETVKDNKISKFDVVIINYDKLTKVSLEKEWGSIVVDESHYVKHSDAKRSKAVKRLSKFSEHIFLLTGTVVNKSPKDLINQLTIIDRLKEFGGWKNFVYRYCGAYKSPWGMDISGATNLKELNVNLNDICYFRREKADVMKDLPDKQYTNILIDIDNKLLYKKAEHDFISFLKENYTQEKVDSAIRAQTLVQISYLKRLSAQGKLKSTIEWIENFLECGRKLVIFCNTREIIDSICLQFDCEKIDGSVDSKERPLIIDRFLKEKSVLALNRKAGGTGIDGLQYGCSDVLFFELPDLPYELEQAEGRIHRSDQKLPVNVYFSIGIDSIDEKILNSLIVQKDITDMVNKGVKNTNLVYENILSYYLE